MSSVFNTRSLVEGAFIAGITAVLGLLGMFIPPFFLIISILMPVPLAVLVRRTDLRVALLSLVVTGLLMMVLYPDPLRVLVMFIQFGPLGLVLGLLYKNHVSAGHALAVASLVSAIASVIVILLAVAVSGLTLEMLQSINNTIMQQFFELNRQAGKPLTVEQQQMYRDIFKTSILLLPAGWIISAVMSAVLSYIVGSKVLKRLNYKVNALPPFSKWRMPWYSIWGLILGLIFVVAGSHFGNATLKVIGQNILMVFGAAFFVLGLSVVAYYYKRLPFSKPFRTFLLVLLIFYIGLMYIGIVVLGVFDATINLRRPRLKSENE